MLETRLPCPFRCARHSIRTEGENGNAPRRLQFLEMPEGSKSVHSRKVDVEDNDIRFAILG